MIAATAQAAGSLVDAADDQARRVERFLYREARLLDERRFDEWLEMLDEDVESIVFSRSAPEPRPRMPTALGREFQPIGGLQLSEDNKGSLQYRVRRLNSGLTFSETPPGRTVRMVTNIEVFVGTEPDRLLVESSLHCNRSRKEETVEDFYARRRDVMIDRDGEMRLWRRHVFLNTTTLAAPSLSIFF